MKAARERLKGALQVNTKKPDNLPSRKKIKPCTEAEVMKAYKLGEQVMESTNTGMDVIFAKRLEDGETVVIKTRKRSNSFKNQSEEREWRMTTEYQLNMPVIESLCQFIEVLETREYYYVIMEKVAGQDLFEEMASKKMSHMDAREIVKQIIEGLQAMHMGGRIHKDLKIENVMVDMESPKKMIEKEMEPCSPVLAKLIDFDTCQDWEPSSPKAKDVLGTDGYIAPEAYSGHYSPASDIYAVGVIMYKLLTGKFPSRAEIFDDQPGENWVGSSAMKRIQDRLKSEVINFDVKPFNKCAEATKLCKAMLEYEAGSRPCAEVCLKDDYFLIKPDALP